MLITKADFEGLVKFSRNIHDNDINPFIQEAIRFLPRIKSEIYFKLSTQPAIVYAPYSPGETITAGLYREYQGKLYKAINDTIVPPDMPQNNGWQHDPVLTVLHLYLKPFLVYKAYDSFLIWHGINIAPAGITQTVDRENYEHVSDKHRGDISNSLKKNILFYQDALLNALKQYSFLEQEEPCNTKRPGFGVYVVGSKRHGRGCGCGCKETPTPPRNNDYRIFDNSYDPTYE